MTSEATPEPSIPPIEPFDIPIRGARLRYVDGGPRDAPSVVFLHGLGREHGQWLPFARAIAAHRRVVALDLPGFGASAPPADRAPPSFEALAEATLDVVAALKLGRVAMIGHSMGAAAAVVAAADRPEFVERLVLVAPTCYRPLRPLDERLLATPVLGGALRGLLGRSVLRRHVGDDARPSPATWAMLSASTSPSTIEARVPRVRAPALVVWGREDPVAPWTHGTRLARELAGARLEILDSGRLPEKERASVLEGLVADFLSIRGADRRASRAGDALR